MERSLNRRQLVASIGAAVLVGGRGAHAQTPPGPPKRVGLMMAIAENDPEGNTKVESDGIKPGSNFEGAMKTAIDEIVKKDIDASWRCFKYFRDRIIEETKKRKVNEELHERYNSEAWKVAFEEAGGVNIPVVPPVIKGEEVVEN